MTIIPYEKSFESHEKAQFWSDKNELKPNEVALNSNKKFWFNCNCGHEINITLSNINSGYWCSYCSNPPKKLCIDNNCKLCFEKSFASSEKNKYFSKKNNVNPRNIFKSSHNKYLFTCDICNHDFESRISDMMRKNYLCPYCAIPSKILCTDNNCKLCFEKSFASHEKSKFWSKKNNVNSRNIFKSSGNKYWLTCNKCNHDFETVIASITTKNTWCPYCSISVQQICTDNSCNHCFNNSFASSDKAKYWNVNNKFNPREISKNSIDKFLFDCDKCNHIFELDPHHITCRNSWCSYCSNKKLCYNNDCNECFNKSFASHKKAKYWSEKNELHPNQIFKGSSNKYLFVCDKNHNFECSISNITCVNRWCPYCVNKTEQKLYDKLSTLYPTLQQQFKVDWCKNKTYLPFDFVIPENKIIIELDGRQHFEQVKNWDDPKKTQENDKYKMKCANDNSYSVIRILQEDVFYDSYDWLSELNNNIKDIIKNKKIQNIYMCKDNEYEIFN
jgi:very-short-patch-repair endonuclease